MRSTSIRKKPVEFVTITPTMRGQLENVIEGLLLLLYEIDGDENPEPDLAGVDPCLMGDRGDDADFAPSIVKMIWSDDSDCSR